MSLAKCFSMAISSIFNNKMRSFLTMLGIIIGIAAVIILVSLMNGLTNMVSDTFAELGTTSINVSINAPSETKNIKAADIFKLAEENPRLISQVSPLVTVRSTVKVGTDSITTSATGVAETYNDMKSLVVEHGRFIQYVDIERMQKVCVIGTYIQKEFFEGTIPIGEKIKINGVPYKIVGILEEKEDSSAGSGDDCIYIPYTNATRLSNNGVINTYVVSAVDEDHVTAVVGIIKEMLNKKIGDSDYYTVISMLSMIDMMSSMMDTMGTMLIAIAAISLLVGGIGIMNIMLVSVTERTREIGIRKSLGAKQKDIMTQFVIEAGTVSCMGGVMGIIVGSGCAMIGGVLLDLTVRPSVGSIAVAFLVSVGIGIAFGFLPAKKAAGLNPIDALRYD
ncbi:MAG: ABC transporter permease [Clostridia bacterium]|nr:ABC transporter permease [Clostridia bacterium]